MSSTQAPKGGHTCHSAVPRGSTCCAVLQYRHSLGPRSCGTAPSLQQLQQQQPGAHRRSPPLPSPCTPSVLAAVPGTPPPLTHASKDSPPPYTLPLPVLSAAVLLTTWRLWPRCLARHTAPCCASIPGAAAAAGWQQEGAAAGQQQGGEGPPRVRRPPRSCSGSSSTKGCRAGRQVCGRDSCTGVVVSLGVRGDIPPSPETAQLLSIGLLSMGRAIAQRATCVPYRSPRNPPSPFGPVSPSPRVRQVSPRPLRPLRHSASAPPSPPPTSPLPPPSCGALRHSRCCHG